MSSGASRASGVSGFSGLSTGFPAWSSRASRFLGVVTVLTSPARCVIATTRVPDCAGRAGSSGRCSGRMDTHGHTWAHVDSGAGPIAMRAPDCGLPDCGLRAPQGARRTCCPQGSKRRGAAPWRLSHSGSAGNAEEPQRGTPFSSRPHHRRSRRARSDRLVSCSRCAGLTARRGRAAIVGVSRIPACRSCPW